MNNKPISGTNVNNLGAYGAFLSKDFVSVQKKMVAEGENSPEVKDQKDSGAKNQIISKQGTIQNIEKVIVKEQIIASVFASTGHEEPNKILKNNISSNFVPEQVPNDGVAITSFANINTELQQLSVAYADGDGVTLSQALICNLFANMMPTAIPLAYGSTNETNSDSLLYAQSIEDTQLEQPSLGLADDSELYQYLDTPTSILGQNVSVTESYTSTSNTSSGVSTTSMITILMQMLAFILPELQKLEQNARLVQQQLSLDSVQTANLTAETSVATAQDIFEQQTAAANTLIGSAVAGASIGGLQTMAGLSGYFASSRASQDGLDMVHENPMKNYEDHLNNMNLDLSDVDATEEIQNNLTALAVHPQPNNTNGNSGNAGGGLVNSSTVDNTEARLQNAEVNRQAWDKHATERSRTFLNASHELTSDTNPNSSFSLSTAVKGARNNQNKIIADTNVTLKAQQGEMITDGCLDANGRVSSPYQNQLHEQTISMKNAAKANAITVNDINNSQLAPEQKAVLSALRQDDGTLAYGSNEYILSGVTNDNIYFAQLTPSTTPGSAPNSYTIVAIPRQNTGITTDLANALDRTPAAVAKNSGNLNQVLTIKNTPNVSVKNPPDLDGLDVAAADIQEAHSYLRPAKIEHDAIENYDTKTATGRLKGTYNNHVERIATKNERFAKLCQIASDMLLVTGRSTSSIIEAQSKIQDAIANKESSLLNIYMKIMDTYGSLLSQSSSTLGQNVTSILQTLTGFTSQLVDAATAASRFRQ